MPGVTWNGSEDLPNCNTNAPVKEESMVIPLYEFPACIDFNAFMDQLETKYGWDFRDMAGRYSEATRAAEAERKSSWMKANGYEGKEHVLDYPKGTRKDWPADSEEMALRIEISSKYEPIRKAFEPPYQDVWHWLLDNSFSDMNNGSIVQLDISDYSSSTPDYVFTFLNSVAETVPTGHPARDGSYISFYVHW